jgi:serine/threonine protein kinase
MDKELDELLVYARNLSTENLKKLKTASELEKEVALLSKRENKILAFIIKYYEGQLSGAGPDAIKNMKEASAKFRDAQEKAKQLIQELAKAEKKSRRISGSFMRSASITLDTEDMAGFADIEIAANEIKLDSVLGKGKYGVVYKGKCYGNNVAVKIPLVEVLTQSQVEEFLQEISIMRNTICPYVVLLLGYSIASEEEFNQIVSPSPVHDRKQQSRRQRQGKLMIVTELCKGNTEQLLLNHSKPLRLDQRMRMAKEAAMGIAWLHGKKIVHRDLKLENLLFDENDTIKVCDMGFAQIKPKDANLKADKDGKVKGSAPYIAPEMWLGQEFYEAADVYSFGIILWEFLTRKRAFTDTIEELDAEEDWVSQFSRKVCLEHLRPTIPPECPESLRELIIDCWADDPQRRPSFRDIVSRLDDVIVDSAIPSAEGSRFWKSNFNTLSEVPFEKFWNLYRGSSAYDVERAASNKAVFQEFFVDNSQSVVSIINFGRMIMFFAPHSGAALLDAMVALYESKWFFCHMSTAFAQRCLHTSPVGTFLIRFSNAQHDCFVITSGLPLSAVFRLFSLC